MKRFESIGPSVEEIFQFIQKEFTEKTEHTMSITIKEVDSIDTSQGPRIQSKIDKTKYTITRYL